MQCTYSRLEVTKLNRLKKVAYHFVFWIFVSVGGIFLLVGSILFIGSAIACVDTLLFLAQAKRVEGTIIELVPNF